MAIILQLNMYYIIDLNFITLIPSRYKMVVVMNFSTAKQYSYTAAYEKDQLTQEGVMEDCRCQKLGSG